MFQSLTQETLGLLNFECHFWTFSDNLLQDNQIIFKIVDNFETNNIYACFGAMPLIRKVLSPKVR